MFLAAHWCTASSGRKLCGQRRRYAYSESWVSLNSLLLWESHSLVAFVCTRWPLCRGGATLSPLRGLCHLLQLRAGWEFPRYPSLDCFATLVSCGQWRPQSSQYLILRNCAQSRAHPTCRAFGNVLMLANHFLFYLFIQVHGDSFACFM